MKAHIEPPRQDRTDDDRIVRVEMEENDRFSFILAQVSLPYLRQRLETATVSVPLIENADLPSWLRRDEPDDEPPADIGREAERWRYVLEEMIWAMEATADGLALGLGRHVIRPGHYDFRQDATEPRSHDVIRRTPGIIDREGVRTDAERRREGLRLFARYVGSI